MKAMYWVIALCFLSFFKPQQAQAQTFEVIAIFPAAADARLQDTFRRWGGTIIDVSPYSKARLWRFPARRSLPTDVYHSYRDSIEGVDRIRAGQTAGVGTGLIEIVFNKPIAAPEGNASPNTFTPQTPPNPMPILPTTCSKVNIGIAAGQKRGVTVAFIDSGVPCDKGGQTHTYLKTAAWYNPTEQTGSGDADGNGYAHDFMGWDFTRNYFIPNDEYGHGTATAGILWSQFYNSRSVAMLKIMPLKVLDKNGTGTLFNLLKAIDYATAKSVDIINISIVSPDPTPYKLPTPIEYVINLAQKQNILVVAAAGNGGADGRSDNIDERSNYVYPASTTNENTLVVGASDCASSTTAFSNYGAQNVDIFAPGKGISAFWLPVGTGSSMRITWGVSMEGTSYATPIVSSVAALLATYQSDKNALALKQALMNGGSINDFLSGKCRSKALINAPNALMKLAR